MIPHQRYDIVAKLHREGAVYCERVCDAGIYLEASVPSDYFRVWRAIKPAKVRLSLTIDSYKMNRVRSKFVYL